MAIAVTDDDERALIAEINGMTEEQREWLDPIASAIEAYRKKFQPKGCRVLENRIHALAAVKATDSIEHNFLYRN